MRVGNSGKGESWGIETSQRSHAGEAHPRVAHPSHNAEFASRKAALRVHLEGAAPYTLGSGSEAHSPGTDILTDNY